MTLVPYAIDLVAVAILTFALYLPRHRRRDLVVAFLVVNVGVLAVAAVLAASTVAVGVGLGLFGVLSIIRLRSTELAQQEIAYYFAALALGLVGGLSADPRRRPLRPACDPRGRLRPGGLPVSAPAAHLPPLTAPGPHLAPVGLAELSAQAGLLTRVDRKYVLPVGSVPAFLDRLDGAQVLEVDGVRSFGYESVYFDTPALDAYRQAARSRPRRFKVRTRTYLDTGTCWLEVKTRDRRGRTVKHRQEHPAEERDRLGAGADFAARLVHGEGRDPGVDPEHGALELHPTLVTRYDRITVWLPGDGARLTIDTRLRCDDQHRSAHLEGCAVVETKTAGRASSADRVLWATGHRPTRISKYATGLAALDPTLPSTRWLTTLRRHPFTVVGQRGPEEAQPSS